MCDDTIPAQALSFNFSRSNCMKVLFNMKYVGPMKCRGQLAQHSYASKGEHSGRLLCSFAPPATSSQLSASKFTC